MKENEARFRLNNWLMIRDLSQELGITEDYIEFVGKLCAVDVIRLDNAVDLNKKFDFTKG